MKFRELTIMPLIAKVGALQYQVYQGVHRNK